MEKELVFLKYNIKEKKYYCLDKHKTNFEEITLVFTHVNDIDPPVDWYIELRINMLNQVEFHFEATGIRDGNKIILEDPFITMVIDNEILNQEHPLRVLVEALSRDLFDT